APPSMSIGTGLGQQFTATAHMSDGTTKDVTNSVQWSSSDANIASVNSAGMASGSAPGTVTITALSGSLKSTAALTVSSAAVNLSSIVVSPSASTLPVNTAQQFTAIGNYSDGSSADLTSGVTWTSSSPSVATINSSGVATTVAAGQTTITATIGAWTDTSTLTVVAAQLISIAVSPAVQSISAGTTQPFTAVGSF